MSLFFDRLFIVATRFSPLILTNAPKEETKANKGKLSRVDGECGCTRKAAELHVRSEHGRVTNWEKMSELADKLGKVAGEGESRLARMRGLAAA